MIWEEIKNIDSSKKELRKFGITIGLVLLLIAAILFYFENNLFQYFTVIGATLILFGLSFQIILLPFHKAWMTLSLVLGFIMSRIILSLLFYLVITPIGFIAKIIGKKFLDLSFKDDKNSYWNYREKKEYNKVDSERQF